MLTIVTPFYVCHCRAGCNITRLSLVCLPSDHLSALSGPMLCLTYWPLGDEAVISSVHPEHRSGLKLAQIKVCCLTAPSIYLNPCWLIIIKGVLQHPHEIKFTRIAYGINPQYLVWDHADKITVPHLPAAIESMHHPVTAKMHQLSLPSQCWAQPW